MYCRHCGGEVDGDSNFCIHCGRSLQLNSTHENGNGGSKKPYERWSWGAFGLGWIYFCGMKYKYWGWLFALGIIVNGLLKSNDTAVGSTGLVIWLIMIIVLGVKGRRIAWESRGWKSKQEFVANQKAWDIWGIIIFVVLNGVWFLVPTS